MSVADLAAWALARVSPVRLGTKFSRGAEALPLAAHVEQVGPTEHAPSRPLRDRKEHRAAVMRADARRFAADESLRRRLAVSREGTDATIAVTPLIPWPATDEDANQAETAADVRVVSHPEMVARARAEVFKL